MSDTVKIHLASPMNISFRHTLDTGMTPEEWDEMSESEQCEIAQELVNEAVEWWVDES